jgi:hypothetical protein
MLGLVITHSFLNGFPSSFFSCDRGIKGYALITQNPSVSADRSVHMPKREHLKGKKTHVLREMSNEALIRLKEGLQNLYLH